MNMYEQAHRDIQDQEDKRFIAALEESIRMGEMDRRKHRKRRNLNAIIGAVYLLWAILVSVLVYIHLIRSPEMTNSQLLLNYWWFYLIVVVGVVLSMVAINTVGYVERKK